MPAAPLLVFDLDGTLAETAGDLGHALGHALALEGATAIPLADVRPMMGAGGRALIARGLATQGRSVSPERLETLFAAFLAHYEAHIADESALFPGVLDALARFEAAGFAFAVCTNKMEHAAKLLLGRLGLLGRLAFVAGQDTFAYCKPDPRALIATIAGAGGDPADAVMVGDSRTDIDVAKAAGVPCVAVDFGYTDTSVRELGPDVVIAHFDALWDAVADLRRSRARSAA